MKNTVRVLLQTIRELEEEKRALVARNDELLKAITSIHAHIKEKNDVKNSNP